MRRGPLTGTLSFLFCLNHLSSTSSMSLQSGFQNCFILNSFCSNALIIFILFFQIVWITEFTRPNSWHLSNLLFPYSICHIRTFLLFVTVVILSHKQSPVNWSSRKVKGNFMHKVNHSYYCHFPGLKFI